MSEIVKKDYLSRQINKFHSDVISSKYAKNNDCNVPTVNLSDDYFEKVEDMSDEVDNSAQIETSLQQYSTTALNKYATLLANTEEPTCYQFKYYYNSPGYEEDTNKVPITTYANTLKPFWQSKIGGISLDNSKIIDTDSPIDTKVYINGYGVISLKDNPSLTEFQNDSNYYCVGKVIDDARKMWESNKILQMYRDIHIIPDQYNTGANNIDMEEKAEEFYKMVDLYGTNTPVVTSEQTDIVLTYTKTYSSYYKYYYYKLDVPSGIPDGAIFEVSNFEYDLGVELSTSGEYQYEGSNKQITVIFNNCKFKGTTGGDACVNVIYNNCTASSFINGRYITVNKCLANGNNGDFVDAFSNVFINDSYFRNPLPTGGHGVHVDGLQVFGWGSSGIAQNKYIEKNASKIRTNNCRYEMHVMYDSMWGEHLKNEEGKYVDISYANAAIFVKADFGNSDDMLFKDVTSNNLSGRIRVCDGSKIPFYRRQRNVCVKGAKSLEVALEQGITDHMIINESTRSHNHERNQHLLVTSVWEDDDNIYFSVSNDNENEKTLTVVTNIGTYTLDVPRCPTFEETTGATVNDDAYKGKDFYTLPFDLKQTIPKSYGVEYMVFYDGLKQVRYVNFTDNKINRINPYDIYTSRTQAPSENSIAPRPNIFYDLGNVSNSLYINFIIPSTGNQQTDVWYMKFVAKSTNIEFTVNSNDSTDEAQTHIESRYPKSFVIGKTYEITMSDYKMCVS